MKQKQKKNKEDANNLERQIEKEIEERKGDSTFLSSEWRELRREGHKPEDIDYDMCHIFR